MKRALVTGITGQDGSYLAELLLSKDYEVIGVTSGHSDRHNVAAIADRIEWIAGDLADEKFVRETVQKYKPDEIYNLASVATVAKPWDDPVALSRIVALSPLYFLESIRTESPQTHFFQASSSEMFAATTASPQNEHTPHAPRNPYGIAKSFAHAMVGGYRANQDLFAVSGILFTHESPRRPLEFVTRKITSSLAQIKRGEMQSFQLGNLDARRDWGFAGDYVEAMWKMLQAERPDDYVIAMGVAHTVREFVLASAKALDMHITFEGSGLDEVGKDEQGRVILTINPTFYRLAEQTVLCGDISKIQHDLGWKPTVSFEGLVSMMAHADFDQAQSGRSAS